MDIESGYGSDAAEISSNIEALCKLGVVGINLEDSVVDGGRELVDAEGFVEKILEIKANLCQKNIEVFLNVRTDPYVVGLKNAYAETVSRVKLYTENGVDGVFVPAIVNESEIKGLVESTTLPINVMCMPELSGFQNLRNLGVKRISMGPFLYNNAISSIQNSVEAIVEDQSFEVLFPKETEA